MAIFDWARTGVLSGNYEKDKVERLIAGIKLDDVEVNWIYIQLVDQLSSADLMMLKKAFGIEPDEPCFILARNIFEYKKKRSKKNG